MSVDAPTTVAELLGDPDPRQAELALRRALYESNVARDALAQVGRFAAAAYGLCDQRVAEALHGLLDIDLGGLIVAGWSRYRELIAAAERTRDTPGQPEDVVLADHQITSTHHPSIEVVVDGRSAATLQFELTVSLELWGVSAIVESGVLVALRCGDVVAGARLSLWGRELARRDVTCVVGALVRLDRGIALVPGGAVPDPSWVSRVPEPRPGLDEPWWTARRT
ncbi:MAG: hypothetical protein ACRDRK_23635 [Pseudonocardia sp.]